MLRIYNNAAGRSTHFKKFSVKYAQEQDNIAYIIT